MPKIKLSKIAERLKKPLIGKERVICGFNGPLSSDEDELTILFDRRMARKPDRIKAKAWVLHDSLLTEPIERFIKANGISYIASTDPYEDMVILSEMFFPKIKVVPRIHSTVIKARTVKIGRSVSIGAFSIIGNASAIGLGSHIGGHVTIGSNVRIGKDCRIYSNVTIYDGSVIGDRVIIHSGSVIGSDGFGFYKKKDRYLKIPHHGHVLIGDDVEIGANCCIDRGTLGATRIGNGCKLDNLIQIAHNVVIGENTVIAAQAGIAGSTTIGRNVTIAGQVGIVGHISIGDGVTIGAQSGVIGSVKPGLTVSGYPARDHREAMRREAFISKIPELVIQLKKK